MPTKIADPPSTVILSRLQLIAAIKRIESDFEESDDQSLDYLRGYYSHAADPVGGTIAKSTFSLNPGAGGGRLDAGDDLTVSVIAARIESERRNAMRASLPLGASSTMTTQEAGESAARALERVERRGQMEAEQYARREQASGQRLDSSDAGLSPVVKAQIRGLEELHRRASRPLTKWNGWGTEGGGGDAA